MKVWDCRVVRSTIQGCTQIEVMPSTPVSYGDVQFWRLRTEGAFLVSSKRVNGKIQFVQIENPQITTKYSPTIYVTVKGWEKLDITSNARTFIKYTKLNETWMVVLAETVLLYPKGEDPNSFSIAPVAGNVTAYNSWGQH